MFLARNLVAKSGVLAQLWVCRFGFRVASWPILGSKLGVVAASWADLGVQVDPPGHPRAATPPPASALPRATRSRPESAAAPRCEGRGSEGPRAAMSGAGSDGPPPLRKLLRRMRVAVPPVALLVAEVADSPLSRSADTRRSRCRCLDV